jgi:hypothetical protein
MSKRTQRGTPRFSRPLSRPAGRTVRRNLYSCASGHTSPSHGLQPVTPKTPPPPYHRIPRRPRHPRGTAVSSRWCVPGNKPGRSGGIR